MMGIDPFADAIAGLCVWTPNPFFVRVGAQDVGREDTLDREIHRRGLSGLIADGAKDRLDAIAPLYARLPGVILHNGAVADANQDAPAQRFKRGALAAGMLPGSFSGIVTFTMESLLAEGGAVGRLCRDAATRALAARLVEVVACRCNTFPALLDQHAIGQIDILMLDLSGGAEVVLRSFDFTRHRPSIVHVVLTYEDEDQRRPIRELLEAQGYHCREVAERLTAVPDAARAAGIDRAGLQALAERCLADGWHDEAAGLARHLGALSKPDADDRSL